MLRLAVVVTRFIAGAGGVALRGALALDPGRYSVVILTGQGGDLLDRAERAGMEVVRLRHLRPEIRPSDDVAALRELTRELAARRFDVVHTHSSKAGALGRLAAHRLGGPAIVHTFHGFPFHRFQAWPRRSAYVAIERRLGRVTDRFLAIGSEVAAEAVRLGIAAPDRVLAVGSAIEPGLGGGTAAERDAARRRIGVPPEMPLVGTVGRLDEQKAPFDMLDAFARLARRDARFVWIGDGPLRRRVEERVRRAGLDGRFLLLGERGDVGALLPALDVFAMASLYEGLPCALIEAMTRGVPVVATAVNSVPDVVHAGRTGLIAPPRAPAALATAIGYLLAHPEHAASMATAARAQVDRGFEPAGLGRDLMDTYERAIAVHRPVPDVRLKVAG